MPAPSFAEPTPSLSRSRARTLVGVAAGALLLAASLRLFSATETGSGWAWVLYGAALAVFVAAFRQRRGAGAGGRRVHGAELAALGIVLIAGAVLRFHRLTTEPYGVWFDEAQNTLVAKQILADPSYRPVFVAGFSQMPALPFYYDALFVALLGPKVLAVRLGATLVGLAALVATWLVGRQLFGPAAGICAAGLLAVSRWHVDFSRFGVAQIFATFAAPLVLWLFVRSQERGSPRGALAAGLGLGIGLQLYYAMTTIPIVLLGAFLHGVVTRRHRGRAAVSLLVLTFATAGAAYAPVLQYSRRHPEAFSERFRAVSAFHVGSVSELARLFLAPSESRPEAIRILKRNVLAHLAMFHVRGDSNGRHNLPGAPMLDPVSGALFALGFLWCLLRIGVGRYFLLLLWFGAMISAGILSVDWEAPQSARTIGLTPVVALMGGVVLAGAWQAVSGSGGSPSRRAAGAALVLVALGAAFVHTWHTYFDKQLRDPAVFAAFSAQETKIGEVVRDEARDADVYVPETLLGGPTETLLIGHPLKANPFERARDLPLEARGRKAIVFFHGHETETLELFQRYYPSVRPQPFGPPGSAPILFVARVSPAELESIRGWTLRYEPDRGHGVEETVRSTEWSFTSSPVPLPFTVHVKGTLRVERDGLYRLVLSGGKPLSLVMDGESLPTTSVVEANLARGSHTVQASFRVTTPSTTAALRWREPGSEREAAIPERNLYSPSLPFGGLLGSFYPRVDCEGTPSFRRIDAQVAFYFHLLPLERPFGVRWTGEVLAPEAGVYSFGTASINESSVRVAGKSVLSNPGTNAYVEGTLFLEKGRHPIEVRYSNTSNYAQIYLYWTTPGGTRELIPAAFLRPPGPSTVR